MADPTTITVHGEGRASAPPDVVRLELGIAAQGDSVGAALADANEGMLAMQHAMRDQGVAEADLRSPAVAVHAVHDRDHTRVVGYEVRQDVSVVVRDVAAAGTVLAAALQAGGDLARMHGLAFVLEDPGPLLAQARAAAVADARQRAEQYGEAADRTVGAVLRIVEQPPQRPGPMPRAMAAMADTGGGVPLQGGTQEVQATVVVELALE
jgi:hypothetical protein